ncbi:MAG TPA: hypothetical protein VER75_06435, partial [Thermoleophilaceae bacterium]|nr:hypothetical protein [Thermoleophilaceae bacterium]
GGLSAADLRAAAVEEQPAAALAGAPADATVVRPPAPTRGGRRALRVALTLVLVAAVLAGLYALSRQVYFVGTNDAGLVTVYRGIPYELPFGVELYEEDYASGMPARAIPAQRRARVLDHEWRSRDDAVDLVRALERGRLDAGGASN